MARTPHLGHQMIHWNNADGTKRVLLTTDLTLRCVLTGEDSTVTDQTTTVFKKSQLCRKWPDGRPVPFPDHAYVKGNPDNVVKALTWLNAPPPSSLPPWPTNWDPYDSKTFSKAGLAPAPKGYRWTADDDQGDGGSSLFKLFREEPWGLVWAIYPHHIEDDTTETGWKYIGLVGWKRILDDNGHEQCDWDASIFGDTLAGVSSKIVATFTKGK